MERVNEKDILVNRTQMVQIAREFNIFITIGTIHRWANEPDFPLPIGKNGKFILYSKYDFTSYLKQRINRIQYEH
ncbi:MAG: hypothetical protein P9X24_02135 [Candidatus Hatepunaea meridiana]|nr:hypothetical protein [Candidatus Hatepunaea meridiana]